MPFSKAQVDSYIALRACPYCLSMEVHIIEVLERDTYRIECENCAETWYERWRIYDIIEEED